MTGIRELVNTKAGRIVAIGLAGCGVLVAVYMISGYFGHSAPANAYSTMYICTETGKTFRHDNVIGETHPILSPFSGHNTGVPAEPCLWTKEGTPKADPTWVLLNEDAGKPGPTFCPDCDRLVVAHNPAPRPDGSPPPTREEYMARHGGEH